jgi:hypothetical protein
MAHCVVYIMSCDARLRSGWRLKSTQAQLRLGREGKAPASCRCVILYYRPSSPFSLSMMRRRVAESIDNDTHISLRDGESYVKASGPRISSTMA